MDKQKILDTFGVKGNFAYGMHACGVIYDLMFTNSYEAFYRWYKHGVRIFEIDIDKTDDGGYVACHNFGKETLKKMEIEEFPDNCTEEWFVSQRLFSRSTAGVSPVSLKRIMQIMKKFPDTIFMIDPKRYSYVETNLMLKAIKCLIEKYEIKGTRIIFETYNLDMIKATKEFEGMLYYQHCIDDEIQMGNSVEMRNMDIDRQIDIMLTNHIYIVSYPWKFAVEKLEILKKLQDEGFVIFSKTRNDIFSDLLIAAGVNVNIVDYLVNTSKREELQDYRLEYVKKYSKKIMGYFG